MAKADMNTWLLMGTQEPDFEMRISIYEELRARRADIKRLTAEGAGRDAKVEELRKFIDLQAEDDGLWFVAETAAEAVVQRGLRGCHAMFEQLFAPVSGSQKIATIHDSHMIARGLIPADSSQPTTCEFCVDAYDESAKTCGDEAPKTASMAWACTRPAGHEGPHIACGGRHSIEQWDATDDSRQECDFEGGACTNPAISETMLSNSGNWYACCDLHAGYARRAKAQFRDLTATADQRHGHE